jgi:hypothetical protein
MSIEPVSWEAQIGGLWYETGPRQNLMSPYLKNNWSMAQGVECLEFKPSTTHTHKTLTTKLQISPNHLVTISNRNTNSNRITKRCAPRFI